MPDFQNVGLVLTRKTGEKLILDIPPSNEHRQVVLTVVGTRSYSVKLGTKADKSISIVRDELVEQP